MAVAVPFVPWPVDPQGHLLIGGLRARDLVQRFGTPLAVLDMAQVRTRVRRYQQALSPFGGRVTYAGKALLTVSVARAMAELDCGVDVVSGGELFIALRAGVPASQIVMHGNFKTEEELSAALEAGVGRIVVDSVPELERLGAMGRARGLPAPVLLRVAPGIGSGAHTHIQTGQEDSKFGLGIRSGEAREAVRIGMGHDGIRLLGLHCHIGSQIMRLAPFEEATDAMTDLLEFLAADLGYRAEELDLGGGLGIRYLPSDAPPTIEDHVAATAGRVAAWAGRHGLPMPRLLLEPGRAIVGEAGVTLYTVGDRKVIPGVRTYLAVDGGMGDNPRPALYGALYQAVAAEKARAPLTDRVRLAGRYCESGDVVVPEAELPPLAAGDLVAIMSTGAYTLSMASTYNRVPRPPLVLVDEGRVRLAQRRETYADLLALEADEPVNDVGSAERASSGASGA
jgi:diaminopimelate decarboxylase